MRRVPTARVGRGGPRPVRDRRGDPERGAVTAELALALPLLLAVTVGLVWLLSVATAQVRVVDAARETARAVARGDEVDRARDLGQRIAPGGARVTVRPAGDRVVAEASARVDGPGGLFDFLPGVRVSARSVALAES